MKNKGKYLSLLLAVLLCLSLLPTGVFASEAAEADVYAVGAVAPGQPSGEPEA